MRDKTNVYNQLGIIPIILTLWQKVVEQRAYMCTYTFMNTCIRVRVRVSLVWNYATTTGTGLSRVD